LNRSSARALHLPRRTPNLLRLAALTDDRHSALCWREFSDRFSFIAFDGRLETDRRRSEQCDCRSSGRSAEIGK